MAAPKGNQFWKARTKHGRDKLFESPELLWEACCEYFEWVESNPILEENLFSYQGVVTKETANKMRAMTIAGICLFLDIDETTWRDWRKDKDFSTVITRADAVMYSQKFSGAAAGVLNPNIIARDLGLSDKQQSEVSGPNGGPVQSETRWVVNPVKPKE